MDPLNSLPSTGSVGSVLEATRNWSAKKGFVLSSTLEDGISTLLENVCVPDVWIPSSERPLPDADTSVTENTIQRARHVIAMRESQRKIDTFFGKLVAGNAPPSPVDESNMIKYIRMAFQTIDPNPQKYSDYWVEVIGRMQGPMSRILFQPYFSLKTPPPMESVKLDPEMDKCLPILYSYIFEQTFCKHFPETQPPGDYKLKDDPVINFWEKDVLRYVEDEDTHISHVESVHLTCALIVEPRRSPRILVEVGHAQRNGAIVRPHGAFERYDARVVLVRAERPEHRFHIYRKFSINHSSAPAPASRFMRSSSRLRLILFFFLTKR
jgi:hypothetical protein